MFSNVQYSRLANDTEIKHKRITKKIATTVGIVQNYVEYSRIQGKNYNCSRIPNNVLKRFLSATKEFQVIII